MSGRVGEITVGRDDVGLDAVGLHLPENMPLADWRRMGERLRDTQQSLMWWVGDWLRFGERKHGVTYADAAELTGYKEGSLRTAVWMAGQFDLSMRIDKLTWHHHRHAASLSPAKRSEALQRAVDEDLSTRQFKALVSEMNQTKPPKPEPKPSEPTQQTPQASPEPSAAPVAAPVAAPAPDVQPQPAPDPYAEERKGLDSFTREGLEDELIEARIALKDEKAKRKKAEADNRHLKERLKEHTGEKDESIRRQAAKIINQRSEVERANQKFEAEKRKTYAMNKEIEELKRQLAAQEIPLN